MPHATPKKYLYIYTITTEGGIAGIERLRQALADAKAIRAKAFIRDDITFVVHAEASLFNLLMENGYIFHEEKLELVEGPSI